MVTYLTREVANRVRFYNLYLQQTLFGDFCVESIYGSKANKKPTGHKRWWFSELEDAKKYYKKILKRKISKGYEHIGKI